MFNWDDPRLARLERAGRAAWVWDVERRRVVWATDAGARLWGLEDAFLLIDKPFGVRDATAEDLALAVSALEHREGVETEIRMWSQGGINAVNVMARIFARTPSGDLVLFTPRAKLHTAQASEAPPANPIADLLGSFPLGLAIFSTAGRSLYANPAFEKIFGNASQFSFADLMGSARGGERLIRMILASGSVRATPTVTRAGAEMVLQVDAALIEDPVMRRSAFLVQAQDVSALRGHERHLSERFETIRALLESAAHGWLVLDRRLNVRMLGGALFDALGGDATRAIGLAWRDARAFLKIEPSGAVDAALSARESIDVPLKVPGQRLAALPQWSQEGDFRGYHVIISSGAVQAGASTPAKERAARILDLGMVALIGHDNFEIVYANERAARLFGAASSSSLIGRPFLDLFPEDEKRASEHYDALAGGARESAEGALNATRLDGGRLVLDAEFRHARLADKSVVLASFQDITRFAAADGGREGASGPPSWFDSIPVALALIDNKGLITHANAQAITLLQRGLDELVGQSFDALVDKPDRSAYEIRRAAATTMAPGLVATLETHLNLGAEHRLPALLTLRPAPAISETGLLIAMTNLEASEERQAGLRHALDQAQDASRQKTEFLSAISHEMRTPLNAIIGFSEFMLEGRLGPIGNEKYAGYIDDIHMSGQHLLSLVNDLLDMSKIEAGRYELQFASVDIDAAIDQAMRMIRPQADKKAVTLVKEAQSVPPVMADARSLRQILLNLLSNAVKFTPGTGQVRVKTSFDAIEGLKIEVTDNGVGMSPAELAHALEPYGQVHGRHANDEAGTGLGLPLAKALAEANHARFAIESAPERGTRASILFPAAQIAEELAGGA